MGKVLWLLLVTATSLSLPLSAQTQLSPATAAKVDYEKDVKPLLSQNCYSCHGEEVQQSGLRLDLRQNALRGGDYGPVIIPGNSTESKLIRRLVDGDGGMQMPPSGPLTNEDIGLLRAWIDQGAEFRTEIAEAPAKPVDPKLAALVQAVRSQAAPVVEKTFAAQPEMIAVRDHAGSSPLHHAAGFGTLETVTWLLEARADVNAKNRRRSTPLHWAVHDEAKVRLLLSRGADVNARQVDGRTALYQAASAGNGLSIMRMLLTHGADPNIATATGQTPLMAAATHGDDDALRLLIENKANINARNGAGETALMFAASDGNPRAVALLIEHGADARVRTKRNETALGNAATSGVEETVQLLLDKGAEVNVRNVRGFSPLMLAASSDTMPAGVIKLLLAAGADQSFKGDYDETARDLAAKRGDTEVTRLLGGGVTASVAPAVSHTDGAGAPERSIAGAVEKALALVEKQSHNFIRIAGCNSCHSQDLPSAAVALARRHGLAAPREIAQLPTSMTAPPERVMDLNVVNVASIAWELFDLGMNGVAKNAYTDAAVRYIKAMQRPSGNWSMVEGRRPPMIQGEFQAAALAIYALKHYSPALEQTSTDQAVAKAVAWLGTATPVITQDYAFQVLGLAWGGNAEKARSAARVLAAKQRIDGGWNQLSTMESDAYATGEVLYALNSAGNIPVTDPVYQKGVQYLLRTQQADGSWHVRSRAIWLQPYFESGFPHGQDQFISTAGTAWASMALTLVVQPATTTQR